MSDVRIFAIYFIAWVILVVASTLFSARRGPSFKKRWHARITLFNIVVIGSFMVFIVSRWGGAVASLLVVVAVVAMGYLSVTRVLVCESCGRTNQPQNLITAPEHCLKCGAKLSRSPMFHA